MNYLKLPVFLILLCLTTTIQADPLSFSSGKQRVNLIELYTSEGCSSCPPADRWINKLKHQTNLWTTVVPVVFHVDYWDYLGWKDKFAQSHFSNRQEKYARKGFVSSVYTPGVMLNGRGWRGWRFNNSAANQQADFPGVLIANYENNNLEVRFEANGDYSDLILNVALLAGDIENKIEAGENQGETLEHNFIVTKLISNKSSRHYSSWKIKNLINEGLSFKPNAVAIWINQENDPTPIQAAGSWLK